MGYLVDLDWALLDYLTTPCGHLSLIRGLGIVAADTLCMGAQVRWYAGLDRLGRCDMDAGIILLSTALLDGWPYAVRRVWSHELGHLVCGYNHERVLLWQSRYGEMIVPPSWSYVS